MQNEIKEYNVLGCPGFDIFVKMVNDAIKDGWQPYGNMQTAMDYSDGSDEKVLWYFQPVVKY